MLMRRPKTFVFLLLIALAGCSSGSSSTPSPQASMPTSTPASKPLEWVQSGQLALPAGVSSMAWDGTALLIGDKGYRILRWDGAAATPTTISEPPTSDRGSGIVGLAVHDGRIISQTAEKGTVRLRDAQGKELQNWSPSTSSGLVGAQVLARNKSLIASVSGRGSVQIIDLGAGSEDSIKLDGGAGNAWTAAWAPTGNTLAVGTSANTIVLAEWPSKTVLATIQIPAPEGKATRGIRGLAFSPTGTSLAAGVPTGLYIADVATQQGRLIEMNSAIQDVAWSPTADIIAVVRDDGMVSVWNNGEPGTDPNAPALSVGTGAYRLAWSADGQRLAIGGDQGVEIWELATP